MLVLARTINVLITHAHACAQYEIIGATDANTRGVDNFFNVGGLTSLRASEHIY